MDLLYKMDWVSHIEKEYCYKAFVTKCYDGDTITCDIEVGFGIVLRKQKIRLFGINTPEVRGEEKEQGYISRDFLRNKILEKDILLYTIKDKKGKYGRMLGIIYFNDVNMNKLLVDEDLAKIAYY